LQVLVEASHSMLGPQTEEPQSHEVVLTPCANVVFKQGATGTYGLQVLVEASHCMLGPQTEVPHWHATALTPCANVVFTQTGVVGGLGLGVHWFVALSQKLLAGHCWSPH